MPTPRSRTRSVAALLLGSALSAAALGAQEPVPSHPPNGFESTPRWVGHFTVFSANALLSGALTGTLRRARGGSFSEGFVHGLVGGSAVYAGKAIAVQRWDGAGLLGRQVAAVGASAVRNAGEGEGLLDTVVLPVGPVRLHVRTGTVAGTRVRASVDLHALFWTGYGVLEPSLRLDAGASLSAGAPVFRTHDQWIIWKDGRERVHGLALAGTVFLADLPYGEPGYSAEVFAHERVHVIQNDQFFHTVGNPLETWLLGRVPGGRAISRILEPNFLLWAAAYPGGRTVLYEQRPWELEAFFLAER
jgi:hypothetical protein